MRLLRRDRMERELDREMQFHLDAAAADHVRAGHSPEEARRLARIEFGGPEQIKEDTRDARGTRWVEDFTGDVRFALRGLRRSPAFASAAVLTIAIGVGANTAVWSIIDALMNRSLPVTRPAELRAIKKVGVNDADYLISHPLMKRMQTAAGSDAQIAGMGTIGGMYATITDQPERILAQGISGNFLSLVGASIARGRGIATSDDETLGGSPVAVITDQFWERRFARDPDIVGRRIRINGFPVTIVGVIAGSFSGMTVGTPVDVFFPLTMQHELKYMGNASASNADTEKPWVTQNGISWLTLIARVPATRVARVTDEVERAFRADLEQQTADRGPERAQLLKQHIELEPAARGFSGLRDQYRDPLHILFGGVALILVIACANLASLVLARSESRTHEIAIRTSLGARTGRLVRQVMTESLTLAVLGGALGLVLAHWAIKALLFLASSGTRAIPIDAGLDGKVLLFAFGTTLLVGVVVGLAPALRVRSFDLYAAFKSGGRTAGGTHRFPVGRMLVAAQMAITLVLVTSAVLFTRTLKNFLTIDAGFNRERVVTARIDPRAAGYTYAELPDVHRRLLEAAKRIPGVQSASLSLLGLAAGAVRTSGFTVQGGLPANGQRPAQENTVSPGYFGTVGIPLLRGRDFTWFDDTTHQKVGIVSEAFAKKFFGTTDVVGKHFGYGDPTWEIIGVAADARVNGLKDKPPAIVYRSLTQAPKEYITTIDVRTSGSTDAAVSGLRRAIAGVDNKLPVREVVALGPFVERGLTRERLVARLASSFGFFGLLLAVVGLYGVISYSVSRRTREVGVRMALGATPGAVSWLVMRDSLTLVMIGVALGAALWFPTLSLTRSLLYGVSAHDPVFLILSIVVLVLAGAVASLLPARRASRIDPIEAIRAE